MIHTYSGMFWTFLKPKSTYTPVRNHHRPLRLIEWRSGEPRKWTTSQLCRDLKIDTYSQWHVSWIFLMTNSTYFQSLIHLEIPFPQPNIQYTICQNQGWIFLPIFPSKQVKLHAIFLPSVWLSLSAQTTLIIGLHRLIKKLVQFL